MTRSVRLAVLGAGLIGKRHIEHVQAEPEAELMAIVDPSSTGKALAEELGVRWAPSFSALIETDRPDGIIIATPNQVHVANGLESVAAGIPALVEKPIADDVDSGQKLVEAAETAGVPLLVGHHRRHNPLIQKAKETIESGRLGDPSGSRPTHKSASYPKAIRRLRNEGLLSKGVEHRTSKYLNNIIEHQTTS